MHSDLKFWCWEGASHGNRGKWLHTHRRQLSSFSTVKNLSLQSTNLIRERLQLSCTFCRCGMREIYDTGKNCYWFSNVAFSFIVWCNVYTSLKRGKTLVFLYRRFKFLGVGNEGFLFFMEMEIPKEENPLFRQMRPNFFSSCKTLNGIHLCYIFRWKIKKI